MKKTHLINPKYPRLTRTAWCGETYCQTTPNPKDATCKRCLRLHKGRAV